MYKKFGITSYGDDIVRDYRAERDSISPAWALLVILLLVLATIQIG